MHLEYWGLSEPPFEKAPDPKFIFHSREFDEAAARLLFAVRRNKGAAMLTGERGSGKTLSLIHLADTLFRDEAEIILIATPLLKPVEFLKTVAYQLGIDTSALSTKADLLHALHSKALRNSRGKKDTVLIIDEAQGLPKETLEEIRLLLNFQSEDRFLMNVVLAGQEDLRATLRGMKQLDQRIAVRYKIKPMDFEETAEYISSRLKTAGAEKRIFTFEAAVEIYSSTRGVPLLINELCGRALEKGFSEKLGSIGSEIIKVVKN
jgi:general secretion pathway protein A